MRWFRRAMLVALVGCGADVGPDALVRATAPLVPTSRDSAGVTIYEHPADALERAPLIGMDSVPFAVIGSRAPDNDVSSVWPLVALSDGRTAVFDRAASQVRLFSSTGQPERAFGAPGEGPGEFRNASVLAVIPGDTMLVNDDMIARLTVLHPDTGFIRMERYQVRWGGDTYAITGRLDDGAWLLAPVGFIISGAGAPEQGQQSPPAPVGRLTSDQPEGSFDTIAMLRRAPTVTMASSSGGRRAEGSGITYLDEFDRAVAWQGGVVTASRSAWELSVRDAQGSLHSIIRRTGPLRATPTWVRDSLVAEAIRRSTDRGAGPGQVEDEAFLYRNMPIADSIAPFKFTAATVGGVLWLGDTPVPGQTSTSYTALDGQGRILGRLSLPSAIRVMAFGDDRVFLRHEDDDGIVTIRVHRLELPD